MLRLRKSTNNKHICNIHDMTETLKGLLIPDDHAVLSEGCKDAEECT